ncbi:MAG: AAA family ATPase [Caldilineaceae bacterium]
MAEALADQMDKLASEYNLTLSERDHKGKFRELILLLAEQNDVILLIDEYDKPITDHLEHEAQLQENIATLRNFYSVLKSPEGERIYFTFITGVSKYGKISIFSELNNLLDITLDVRFATLLGYTQTELEHYFSNYIDRLVTTFQTTHAEILKQIARCWYDGYSWDGAHTVYVPYSTLLFWSSRHLPTIWYSTGTPSFLIKLLRSHHIPAYQLADLSADATLLESADVNDISVLSLCFKLAI